MALSTATDFNVLLQRLQKDLGHSSAPFTSDSALQIWRWFAVYTSDLSPSDSV